MQHFKNFGKIQSFYFPTVYNISKLYEIWRQKSSPASAGLSKTRIQKETPKKKIPAMYEYQPLKK